MTSSTAPTSTPPHHPRTAHRRLPVAMVLALLGLLGAASGTWQFAHDLLDHVASRAQQVAASTEPGPAAPQTPTSPDDADDCALCHLLTSVRAATLDLLPTTTAAAPLVAHLHLGDLIADALTDLRRRSARGPPLLA